MTYNSINLKYLNVLNINQETETKIIYSDNFEQKITLTKQNTNHCFNYTGFSIIKTVNTNKAIRELLYQNNVESYIKINDLYIRTKDIIIISPFTRINDILSSRSNNNVHNYLKDKNYFNINNEIENYICEKINNFTNEFNDLIDIDLNKCEIMNFINIKDDFISKENIKKILNILKTYNQKKLIIFNDVDYLDFNDVANYMQFFNFLYFVNNQEENYFIIQNHELYLINYDNLI